MGRRIWAVAKARLPWKQPLRQNVLETNLYGRERKQEQTEEEVELQRRLGKASASWVGN